MGAGLSVTEVLERAGGVARRRTLLVWLDRVDLERAVSAGDVVRDGWGRYALPGADEAVRAAAALGGVVGLTSAALHHGWAVKQVPARPEIVLSRGRTVTAGGQVRVHRAELGPSEVDGHWTRPETTLAHCMRRLPFDEALCVVNSALREGVGEQTLQSIADQARGPGAAQMRRLAQVASALPANPFESCLMALALDVTGLDVQPQVELPGLGRPDFVDVEKRLVLEADSFAWHGKRRFLAADARRYNAMVCAGWMVLRFSYEDVMGDPADVQRVLGEAVALASHLNNALALLPRPA
ncbi:MAG: DUF559 domain-containing protein [Nocardioides sp.]